MADDATITISATFATREAADLAVEHLVQQYGISRPDIFVRSIADQNSTGSQVSRGDVDRSDAPLEGEIEVSADIPANQISTVQRGLGDAGAIRLSRQ